MRIGIDGQLLAGKKTGMGIVLENILVRLSISKGDEVYLYLNDSIDTYLENIFIEKGIIIKKSKKYNYMVWEQIILPFNSKKDKIDYFWFPYNTASILMECKTIVTIHDLIYMNGSILSPPTLYKKMGKTYRRIIAPIAIRNADRIVTISNNIKQEIIDMFPEANKKITVAYNGCEYSNKYLDDYSWKELKENENIRGEYILAFGSLEERKNTMATIKAFEIIKSENPEAELILFGFRGFEHSMEYKYVIEKKIKGIHFMGYISEEEKNSLYLNAKCFLFPSLSEGFGLPILEAFYNEVPVITSNCSSMPEVAGDAAIFINPYDINSIVKGIKIVYRDTNVNVLKGKERLKKFNWDTTTKVMEVILFNKK